MVTNSTDAELMARLRNGDIDAFEALHRRHAPLLTAVARRIVGDPGRAEEAVQDGFIAVWRHRARYSPALGSARAWITQIVRRKAIDLLRKDASHLRHRADDCEHPSDEPVARWLEELDRVAMSQSLRSEIERLPRAQYRVLDLAYYCGLSQTQIAELTGLPLGTVKGRARLGIEKLRDHLTVAAAP